MKMQTGAHTPHRSESRQTPLANANAGSDDKHGDSLLQPRGDVPLDIDLTIRNLRFLDLDLQADWPGLGRDTFRGASKDAKTKARGRVQAAEWVLFKLFEIYDPRGTRSSLQQFFPALEPRQSISLRAALFQLLTTLKQTGVLARECALRRSLLDDCRGERFEELLFHFSSMVLRNRIAQVRQGHALPATRIATSKALDEGEATQLEPLALALRSSLAASLNQRAHLHKRLESLRSTLTAQGNDLEARNARQRTEVSTQEKLLYESNANVTELKTQLRNACEANLDWVNLAISGDNNTDRLLSLEAPFDSLWKGTMAKGPGDHAVPPPATHGTVITEIDARISDAKDRLDNWRAFQSTLSMRNEELTISKSPLKTPGRSPLKRSPVKSPNKPASQLLGTPRSPTKPKVVNGQGQLRRTTRSIQPPSQRDDKTKVQDTESASRGLAKVIDVAKPTSSPSHPSRLAESPLVRPLTSDKPNSHLPLFSSNESAFAGNNQHFASGDADENAAGSATQQAFGWDEKDASGVSRELRRRPMTFTISRPYMSTPTTTKLEISDGPSSVDATATSTPIVAEPDQKADATESPTVQSRPQRLSLAERVRHSMALADTLRGQRAEFLASVSADTSSERTTRPSQRALPNRQAVPSTGSAPNCEADGVNSLSDRVHASVGNRTTLGATDRPQGIGREQITRSKHSRERRQSHTAGPRAQPLPDIGAGADEVDELTTAMDMVDIGSGEDEEHDYKIDTRPKTPIGELFDAGADYGSVFKSRSKMRRSPPPTQAPSTVDNL